MHKILSNTKAVQETRALLVKVHVSSAKRLDWDIFCTRASFNTI